MIILKECEFGNVVELLNQEKVHSTFAYAVVEGIQKGKIYVDTNMNPKCCLIVCESGKYLVAGETINDDFNEFIQEYLLNRKNHRNYFDLYFSSTKWIVKLNKMIGNNAVKLSRELFVWDYSKLSSILKWSEIKENGNGFEVKKMNSTLFEKYIKEVDSSYKNLWGSSDNFLKNGFGFCVLKDNKFVSVCNTYYVRQGVAEIDIITMDEFRSKGFALLACSEFIKHCVKNDIKPVWDCDKGNENSKKLAIKLGFKIVETYEMYWWHENRKFVEEYLNKFNYNTKKYEGEIYEVN